MQSSAANEMLSDTHLWNLELIIVDLPIGSIHRPEQPTYTSLDYPTVPQTSSCELSRTWGKAAVQHMHNDLVIKTGGKWWNACLLSVISFVSRHGLDWHDSRLSEHWIVPIRLSPLTINLQRCIHRRVHHHGYGGRQPRNSCTMVKPWWPVVRFSTRSARTPYDSGPQTPTSHTN